MPSSENVTTSSQQQYSKSVAARRRRKEAKTPKGGKPGNPGNFTGARHFNPKTPHIVKLFFNLIRCRNRINSITKRVKRSCKTLDGTAFTARILAELQTIVGASGIVGLTYLDAGTYHNAPAELRPLMRRVLGNLRHAA